MRALLAVSLCLFWINANAQCRVLDPELQGSYSGGCANGLAEGEGVARGAAEYRGGFRQGRKHGQGVKSWPNGDRFEGSFVDDRREGFGIYTWGRGKWAGERYEGGYSNDQRHGYGQYRWSSGDYYAGPWENDVASGPPTPMMLARRKYEEETRAAVAKEGVKACREVTGGLGKTEWIRGIVVAVNDDQVGVRIDEPGRQGRFKVGETIWDEPTAWIPCL
jgi:hypothetical protein